MGLIAAPAADAGVSAANSNIAPTPRRSSRSSARQAPLRVRQRPRHVRAREVDREMDLDLKKEIKWDFLKQSEDQKRLFFLIQFFLFTVLVLNCTLLAKK